MAKNDGVKKKSFVIGYSLVFHSLLMFLMQGILTTSGNNIFIPYFVREYGWDRTTLLNLISVAALVAVLGAFIFPQMVKSFGPRKVTVLALILGGAATIFFGRVSSVLAFLVAAIFIFLLAQGWAGVTTNTLMVNWFPRNKGTVLGISSIGLPLCSVVAVPVLNYLVNNNGFSTAYLFAGGFMIVLGIISIFWVKDNPEDLGLAPDNDKLSAEQMKVATERLRNFKSQWPAKELLRERNAWLYVLGYGSMFMVNKAMLSQLVVYFLDKGFEQQQAVTYMSLFAFLAIAGSWLWGVIDDKMGTKPASILYGILYAVGFTLMFLPGAGAAMWIGVCLFEFNQAGGDNLMTSMLINCYGRYEYPSINRVLQPMVTIVAALATWFVGVATNLTGSTAKAPIVFAGLVIVATVLVAFMKANPRTDINYDTAGENLAESSETKA